MYWENQIMQQYGGFQYKDIEGNEKADKLVKNGEKLSFSGTSTPIFL